MVGAPSNESSRPLPEGPPRREKTDTDRHVFTCTAAVGAIGLMAGGAGATATARVRGDLARPGAALDRRVYGQNLEFMGRQFKGGIIAAEESRAPTFGPGLRTDVFEALTDLGITHLRWPGGCFADAYHWRDGVGDDRPGYMNPMWGNPMIRMAFMVMGEIRTPVGSYLDNRFGTDEFMEYCRALGAEPSLTASMEAETPDEAAAWVAYLRDRFGADAVPVWSVGNEQWNPFEHNGNFRRPGRYVERYHQWARAMRRENPSIKLVASGQDPLVDSKWNRVILEGIGRAMDYFSLHVYVPMRFLARDLPDNDATYWVVAASHRYVERSIELVVESMRATLGQALPVSLDEWNILATARNFIVPKACMREAVGVAGIIHVVHRNAEHVRLANQFAPVNAAAPAIITDRDRLARTPVYHVLRLYSRRGLPRVCPVEVFSPTFTSKNLGRVRAYTDTPVIDASLTAEGKKACLFLINRNPREEVLVELEIEGIKPGVEACLETVTGPDSYRSTNLVGEPEVVSPITQDVAWPERMKLPPCSVSALAPSAGMP